MFSQNRMRAQLGNMAAGVPIQSSRRVFMVISGSPTWPIWLQTRHKSYWDGALWADIQISLNVLSVLLAHTSYSSRHTAHQVKALQASARGNIKISFIFAVEQQISLRAKENVRDYDPFRAHLLTLVGLLLDKDEASDVVALVIDQIVTTMPSLTEI